MSGLSNDLLRWAIGVGIRILGFTLDIVHRLRLRFYYSTQRRLKKKYRIRRDTPVVSSWEGSNPPASRGDRKLHYAVTSGTTAEPKAIPYTRGRLFRVKWAFCRVYSRFAWRLSVKHPSLYIFSSLRSDDSLSSLLLETESVPPHLALLQAPYRIHSEPCLAGLSEEYGEVAVRLWVLIVSNPGVLYATNPSTLTTFFSDLEEDWTTNSRFVREFYSDPKSFSPEVRRIYRRLRSLDTRERMKKVAESNSTIPFHLVLSRCRFLICWTGGYLRPFLDRLDQLLPPQQFTRIPMYSMSTETIETITHFEKESVRFLPVAGGVLYEFCEEGEGSARLLSPARIKEGRVYMMVVSNGYGLRRYQTGDLFKCTGFIAGVPCLEFLRRGDLVFSFTGEKLTGEQLIAVFDKLRKQFDLSISHFYLSCIPSFPVRDKIPHYKIVAVQLTQHAPEIQGIEVATSCDRMLQEINCEYKQKRLSGRLGHLRFVLLGREQFIVFTGGARHAGTWESQFKFLPLYRTTWEDLSSKG